MKTAQTINQLIQESKRVNEFKMQYRISGAIALYGAGNVGRDVFKLLRNSRQSVKFFLDQTAGQDRYIDGIPVLNPNSHLISIREREETTVIVSIFNPFVDMTVLHDSLSGLGYKIIVTFVEFHKIYNSELGDRFWLTGVEFYQAYGNQLQAVAEMFEDEKSRDLFERIISFRSTGNHRLLPSPDLVGQYFPEDLPKWKLPLRFVDCGACTGDTIEQIINRGLDLEAVVAFEPDLINYVKLTKALNIIRSELNCCSTWPCGVSSDATQFKFDGGQGTGSAISATGSQIIQCVSLDQALIQFQPNLIKMDIEGSEYEALLGAQMTIERYRPGLAICLYHRPQHLWQIPLLIKKITNGGGSYFLRCHGFNGFELVLYWVP